MKTAIQQLRNDIIIEMKLGYISEHSGCRVLNHIDNLYLEEEKKQITKAVDYGCSDWGSAKDGEKYYNETYNNENTNSDSRI